jgi:hypothetical protein
LRNWNWGGLAAIGGRFSLLQPRSERNAQAMRARQFTCPLFDSIAQRRHTIQVQRILSQA